MDEIKLEETEEIEETEIDELTETEECEPEEVATTKDENNEVAQAETAKLKDKKTFIHLHVHTEFSLLDGAARLTLGKKHPLLQACKAKNMPAIAITDHGVMYGVNLFYNYCIDEGIKPIIGCEFYTCEDMHVHSGRGDTNHLVLIAKNDIGYKNLVKLDSMAFLEGKYYKPRIDLNFLRQHSEGLICLSACLAGKIPRLLLQDDYEGAKAYALELKSIFAEGDFYIEIQDHGIAEQKATNPLLVKIAREIGVKVVATNDVHYINKKDAEMHDVLLCIQTGKTFNDTERMRFDGEEFYLKDYDEMYKLFSWCPESLQTPFEIVDKCDVHIKKENLMPPYTPEDGTTPEEYLRKLAYEGLEKRYGNPLSDEIKQRAEYELSVIIRMGFAEYYLIVWDFIDFARKNDIPVGAGRGSGVGSIIAYAIGITNVEPLRYNLLFERFLNPERVSNPDFDIDLCSEGREDVIKYVTKKYGADKVCQIITFGTMATKNAIKDVARVYEVPFDIVNKITKLIPMGKITIADVLGESGTTDKIVRELVEMYESDDTIKKVLDMAKQIEGMPRQTGKHAAGVVICKEVISDFVPLQEKDGDVTTQYQKDEVEALGMLKMDFLGLRTLTDIKKAKHYITETTGTVVDFEQIGYADPEVYNLIGTGETDAVFQLESGGMKKFMRELMPKSLEDIIAGISLYRPGPMDSIPKYIESKNNPEKISYDHPLLEPILNMTYGCIVYQEQVMQVVQRLGGYTFGRADLLRRAMGKKKADVMKEEKSIFINGCAETKNSKGVCGAVASGVPEAVATKIFNDMESFASYAFNKSHAAAYAVLAYETAFLKRYYPVQFIAAVINNRITVPDEITKYITYLRDHNVEVFTPNINKSKVYFSCENNGLRFGLLGIKNVGEAGLTEIVKEREEHGEFKSLEDLLRRIDVKLVTKRMMECLIKAGAFDCFGHHRSTLISVYEKIMDIIIKDKRTQCTGQMLLFDLIGDATQDSIKIVEIAEYTKKELFSFEKEVLNLYVSGNPLEEYKDKIHKMPFNLSMIADLMSTDEEDEEKQLSNKKIVEQFNGKRVQIGGLLADFTKKMTKKGVAFGVGVLEDLYGSIDILFFSSVFEKYKGMLVKDKIYVVSGVINLDEKPKMNVNSIVEWSLEEDKNNFDKPKTQNTNSDNDKKEQVLYLNLTGKYDMVIDNVLQILGAYGGSTTVKMQNNKTLLQYSIKVNPSNSLLWELESLLGKQNIKLM